MLLSLRSNLDPEHFLLPEHVLCIERRVAEKWKGLRWLRYPGIYFLDFTHNLTTFYCRFKLISVVILKRGFLAFGANHFLETFKALFKFY